MKQLTIETIYKGIFQEGKSIHLAIDHAGVHPSSNNYKYYLESLSQAVLEATYREMSPSKINQLFMHFLLEEYDTWHIDDDETYYDEDDGSEFVEGRISLSSMQRRFELERIDV